MSGADFDSVMKELPPLISESDLHVSQVWCHSVCIQFVQLFVYLLSCFDTSSVCLYVCLSVAVLVFLVVLLVFFTIKKMFFFES